MIFVTSFDTASFFIIFNICVIRILFQSLIFLAVFLPTLDIILNILQESFTRLTIRVVLIIAQLVVTVSATFREVRMFIREDSFLLAGVESEDLLFGCGCAVFAFLDGIVRVGGWVFSFADADGGASAVPSVGRKVFVPEWVCHREGDTVEFAVFLPHAVVTGCAVLEVVAVGGPFPLFPFHGHLGGCCGEVVFRLEVVAVIGVVDGFHILVELLEGLEAAVIRLEHTRGLFEFVVCFEAGEVEYVLAECGGEVVWDFLLYGQTVEFFGQHAAGGVDEFGDVLVGQHFGRVLALLVDMLDCLFKCR